MTFRGGTTAAPAGPARREAAGYPASPPRSSGPAGLRLLPPLAAVAAAVALFLYRFGLRVLDPTNIEWMMSHRDFSMFFFGWHFFRAEDWGLPLGAVEGYQAPIGTNIGLTDSLPILALPFKLIEALLPAEFQYFGLAILAGYCLQALFGYLLVGRVTGDRSLRLLGALWFLFSPVLLLRKGHVALANHWLLLAALWLYWRDDAAAGPARPARAWILLCLASALIHPYLAVMVGGITAAFLGRRWLFDRRSGGVATVLALLVTALALLVPWTVIGYFGHGGLEDYGSAAFTEFSLNLNAPFNPLDNSRLLPELPTVFRRQRAGGFSYLGAGMMALALLALALTVRRKPARAAWRRHLPLALLLALFFVWAVGPTVTWSDRVLWSAEPSGALAAWLGVFRAPARFVWPHYYLLFFGAIAAVARGLRARWARVALAAALLLQIWDVTPLLKKGTELRQIRLRQRLESPQWARALAHFDRLVTVPPLVDHNCATNDYRSLALLAAAHGKSVTVGRASRRSEERVAEARAAVYREVLGPGDGEPPPDPRSLFILTGGFLAPRSHRVARRFHCGVIDGYPVCAAKGAGYRPSPGTRPQEIVAARVCPPVTRPRGRARSSPAARAARAATRSDAGRPPR